MDPQNQGRSQGLDIARGTAVILMVVYHMCEYALVPTNGTLLTICMALKAFRMPILFLISGFLSATIVYKPRRQALLRISNFVWLYLLWLPVMLIVAQGAPPISVAFLLENVWQPRTELWFIWALAIMVSSLFVVTKLPRRTILLAFLVIAAAEYSGILGLSYTHDKLILSAPLFYVGALYRDEMKRVIKARFSVRTALGILVGIGTIHIASEFIRQSQGWQVLGSIERIAVCVAAIYLLKPVEKVPAIGGWLASIGQNTLPIYLIHFPLWIILRPFMPSLGGVATPLVSAALLVSISLLIHHAVCGRRLAWLFEQPLWWSNAIAQAAGKAVWAVDRRYAVR